MLIVHRPLKVADTPKLVASTSPGQPASVCENEKRKTLDELAPTVGPEPLQPNGDEDQAPLVVTPLKAQLEPVWVELTVW
jgi:hypothetical protein